MYWSKRSYRTDSHSRVPSGRRIARQRRVCLCLPCRELPRIASWQLSDSVAYAGRETEESLGQESRTLPGIPFQLIMLAVHASLLLNFVL